MNKYRVFSLLLSLSCPIHAGQTNTLKQFSGEWEGMGIQDNGTHWSIRLNIRPDAYVIDYPSLVCGGTWTLIKTTDTSLVFKETLTYGIRQCIDHGEVVINKLAEDKARYYWFNSENRIEATGDLTRKSRFTGGGL